ncbi:uncharacterized protein [Paramisgurnus dabryanus]|uniref:uncharacterized protein isoform X2 n=1 Tax=Paramisgurnus dabryanus TaxID=90735 RepID=UPI0031F43A19
MYLPYFFLISTLMMIVDGGFTLTGSSGPLVVPLGGSVVLPCSVETPLPLEDLEIDWKRSDKETLIHLYQDGDIRPEAQHQDYHDRAHFFPEDIKHGNFSLLLNNLTAEDEGQYTCKVYSGKEAEETVVEVQSGERLTVSGSNHSISAYEGEDVTLNCSVNSHIKPKEVEEVSWKKRDKDEEILVLLYQDNKTLPEASDDRYRDRVEFFTDEIHRGNFSLRLKRVRTEDKGLYICRVFTERLSANTTVILEQLGFSGLHIFVLLLCIAASGSAVIISCLIYWKDTSRCVPALKVSLVICPNICMFIAFIIWGVTEGSFKESVTCCALYILRPVTLFWAVPDLDDLQDRTKPWITFSTISSEFAALTVIVYSVLFTYAWKRTENFIQKGASVLLGICFGLLLLLCLCIFAGGFCGIKQTKNIFIMFLLLTQFLFLLILFNVPSPDLMDLTCVVFVAVLLILVVYEDKGHVHLHNRFVLIFGAVGIILLNTATLAAELFLKKRNGERALGDLRVIVFPSECAFILCWLLFSTYAWCFSAFYFIEET